MEQVPSRGHEVSPQGGLGVDCELRYCSKKLLRLSVRAQAWLISISLSFSVLGGSSFLSPSHSAIKFGAWKCNTWPR